MNSREEKSDFSRSYPRGALESPFLAGELFVEEAEPGWEARLAALEAESPFRDAFEQHQAGPAPAWQQLEPGDGEGFEEYEQDQPDEETEGFEFDTPPAAFPTTPDPLLAIPAFSGQARASVGALLKPAKSKTATRWNAKHHPRFSGLEPANILDALKNYVDLTAVKQAIDDHNAGHPGDKIDPGTPPADAVFTEAVHQFQMKCYRDTDQHDGVAGPALLDSLGFWPRKGLTSKAVTNDWAKRRIKARKTQIDEALAVTSSDLAKGLQASRWWSSFLNPCFLGWGFRLPIHVYFARKLRKAEKKLLSQARFTGKTPAEMAALLEISEKHAGGRDNSDSKSIHTLGLAIDIRYKGNPHVGDEQKPNSVKFFSKVMQRAVTRISGITLQESRFPEFLSKLGRDEAKSTGQIHDELVLRDQDLRQYLDLPAASSDLAKLRNGVFKGRVRRDPKKGFLNLDKDLVIALRDDSCLVWGAVDFGDKASGDMMHFDCRLDDIGRAVYCGTGGHFNDKHPCWRRAAEPCPKPAARSGSSGRSKELEDFEVWGEGEEPTETYEPVDEQLEDQDEEFSGEAEGFQDSDEFEEYWTGEEDLIEAEDPPLASHPSSSDPPGNTIYVQISLGKDVFCGHKDKNGICDRWRGIQDETGIFIPENYSSQSVKVDILLYLHGHKTDIPGSDALISTYWDGKKYSVFALREVINASRKNVILVAPTLGLLSESGTLACGNGLDTYLDQVLAALKKYGPYKGKSPSLGNLILAAHSGGGKYMTRLAVSGGQSAAKIKECWGFDSLYNTGDIDYWLHWSGLNPGATFYSYYLKPPPTANSKSIKWKASKLKLTNIKTIEVKGKNHFTLVKHYLAERLRSATYLQGIATTSPELPEDVELERELELEYLGEAYEDEEAELEGEEPDDEAYESVELEDEAYEDRDAALFEAFVPIVSQSKLRTRIDEYFELANAEYDLGGKVKVRARPQFRYSKASDPETAKATVNRILGKEFERRHPRAIHNAAYGRAKPSEIAAITQALIDKGEFTAVRDDNPGLPNDQLVRKLQRKFRMGIDCAGYVQLAFIFAYLGNDNDTKTVRVSAGLKERRGDEKLAGLPSSHFTKVNLVDARTGDLIVLYPRLNTANAADCATAIKKLARGDRSGFNDLDWHTVIIVERTTSGDEHTFLVDASWGTDTYGEKYSGVARRKIVFDSGSREWWDIAPGKVESGDTLSGIELDEGDKSFQNKIGPYSGHCIKGVYRAKQK